MEQVESDCLLKAKALLKSETVPTEATVKMVQSLVEAAVLIDDLDLRWKQHEHPAAPFGGIYETRGCKLNETTERLDTLSRATCQYFVDISILMHCSNGTIFHVVVGDS